MPDSTHAAADTLTDGTGVSEMDKSKVIKDLVLDFLLTGAAALGASATLDTLDINAALAAPHAVGIALFGAAIRTLYRFGLRWAQS